MDKNLLNDLIIDIQNGNDDAFAKLYELANKSVFSFVYLIIKDRFLSEDITQDTFIKLKKSIMSYRPETNPSAWIFQIAKNTALDYLRKNKNTSTIDITEIDIKDNSNNKPSESNLYIHNLLIKYLDENEREIVLLHLIHGYKHREIAKFLKEPLGTILWKYNRALKILKQKIKEEEK